jgi:hypothetical protein
MSNTDSGLEARYEVRKLNDPTGKHEDCRYFVLDPQHDPIARRALLEYAREAHDAGYVELSHDLMTWLGECYEGANERTVETVEAPCRWIGSSDSGRAWCHTCGVEDGHVCGGRKS